MAASSSSPVFAAMLAMGYFSSNMPMPALIVIESFPVKARNSLRISLAAWMISFQFPIRKRSSPPE